MSDDRSGPWRGASVSPRDAMDNAYDDAHEHPTEWPDDVSVEPKTPSPDRDPVEASTEPRQPHPERSHRIARPMASRHREGRSGIMRISR